MPGSRVEDVILRGTRAAQPLATGVSSGAIYCVTDEGNILERSNGTVWQAFSPTAGGVTLADVKDSVRAATTAAGTLATSFENGDTIDGVVLATGNRILIKNQAAGAENGVYTVAASGAPTRATDFDVDAEVTAGAFVFVSEGTTNGNTGWVMTADDPITVGTTALTFAQFTGGAGSHEILSATHSDTTAATVVRGDIVVAKGATPKWERLAKGTSGHVLTMGADEPAWSAAGAGGMTAQDQIDLAWGKKFFSDAGVLPATERVAASLVTFPTETAIVGGGAFTKIQGNATWVRSGGTDGGAYWDLGALRSEVLVVLRGMTVPAGAVGMMITVSPDIPAAFAHNNYAFSLVGGANPAIKEGSGFGVVGTAVPDHITRDSQVIGLALYYNDTTNVLRAFMNENGPWFRVVDTTDTTYGQVRYVSIMFHGSAGTFRAILPFTVWSD